MITGSAITSDSPNRLPVPASGKRYNLRFFETSPLVKRAVQVSDEAVRSEHNEESLAPAGLHSVLQSCLVTLDNKSRANTTGLMQSYAGATQRSMLENEIQQLRLYNCTCRIFEQCNELAKRPDWSSLFTKARWSQLMKDAWYTKAELKKDSEGTTATHKLPPTEENLLEAELRAAQYSIFSNTSKYQIYDELVAGRYLNVIKNLALEKLRITNANDLLKQYNLHFQIQSLNLMEALQNAVPRTVHQETRQENQRLVLRLECKEEESEWMESAWKTAVKERDAAIRECDALKVELDILRAEKDTTVAKAKEEGRRELSRIVAQSLQATIAIVGPAQEHTIRRTPTRTTITSSDSGLTRSGDRTITKSRRDR